MNVPIAHNPGLIASLATIATSLVFKYAKLDMMMYGVIYGLIIQLLENYDTIFDKLNVNDPKQYLLIGALISTAFILYHYSNRIINFVRYRNNGMGYYELNLYDKNSTKTILNYIDNFPDFFSKSDKIDHGNLDFIAKMMHDKNVDDNTVNHASIKWPSEGSKITFNDKNFGVTGCLYFLKKSVKTGTEEKQISIDIPYIQLLADKKTTNDVNDYFKKITDKNYEIAKKSSILLNHTKIIKSRGDILYHDQYIYNGPIISREDFEKRFMNTFFHPEKEKLYRHLRMINDSPNDFYNLGQSPRCGLLLYGPPGTGKSTFAYRVAMCLNRHIVTVDLRSIKAKSTIFNIIHKPTVNGTYTTPDKVVFVLDEFDLTVTELYHKNKTMNSIVNLWESKIKMFPEGKKKKKEQKNDNKSKNSSDEEEEYSDIYSIDKYGYDNENINLGDLLELFNGPVPNDGMIVIATTNKYKEINDMCPALFRHGRLSPIYFGYAEAKIIQQMSEYYFNEKLDIPINYEPHLATSQILEIIVEAKLDPINKGFPFFREQMDKIMIKPNQKNEI